MSRLDSLRSLPLFVLLEVAEPSWTPAAMQRLHAALPRPGAEELGMLVAHDLARIVPSVGSAGVCFLGASFEPTEVLQPGLPLFTLLAEQYRLSLSGEGFQRRLLFLGALDGVLPDDRLTPDRRRQPSPWRVLPLSLICDPQDLAPIDADLESVLLDGGECAPPVGTALASWFGVDIAHARYLTLLDLLALLRAQYQQAGLDLLADLLEASLLRPDRAVCLADPNGLRCAWDGARVRLRWQALDPEMGLGGARREQFRLQRLLMQGLPLHGLELAWVDCPTDPVEALLDGPLLQGDLVVEGDPDDAVTSLRAYTDPELGVLVVDGLNANSVRHCRMHPLTAAGLNQIQALLPGRTFESVTLAGCA